MAARRKHGRGPVCCAGVVLTCIGLGLAMGTAGPASAAVLGSVTINPQSGDNSTLFGGSVDASCPAGTADSYWTIDGADLPADQAILAPGNSTGTGPQSFRGASVANLRSANAGSFSASGPYQIKFNCVDGSDGSVSDTYQSQLNYTAGGAGSWTIVIEPPGTRTTPSANPAGPYEVGTLTDLTADVTPTTGADNPTSGSVEFFRNETSLGVDTTLSPTGVANLNSVSLPVGSNSLTAVYTPGTGFTGSTSPAVVVQVTPPQSISTTSVLDVTPVSGAAYQAVTLTCTVSAGSFQPNGTATFTDNGTTIGSAPVTAGSPAAFTSSSFGPGAHSLVCNFVGSAPYTNSTSNTVSFGYPPGGGDPQTVVVTIPQGVLTITTPYTPTSPLSLGTATLDPSDSTYSASAQFGTSADGYIVITDTRSSNLGWTASLGAKPFVDPRNGHG